MWEKPLQKSHKMKNKQNSKNFLSPKSGMMLKGVATPLLPSLQPSLLPELTAVWKSIACPLCGVPPETPTQGQPLRLREGCGGAGADWGGTEPAAGASSRDHAPAHSGKQSRTSRPGCESGAGHAKSQGGQKMSPDLSLREANWHVGLKMKDKHSFSMVLIFVKRAHPSPVPSLPTLCTTKARPSRALATAHTARPAGSDPPAAPLPRQKSVSAQDKSGTAFKRQKKSVFWSHFSPSAA